MIIIYIIIVNGQKTKGNFSRARMQPTKVKMITSIGSLSSLAHGHEKEELLGIGSLMLQKKVLFDKLYSL